MVKIFETILYNRILPVVEPRLSMDQYAYRGERSTEMVLAEIMDFTQRALIEGHYLNLASYHVEGAFGEVPHWHLMEALKENDVRAHERRATHEWLRSRTFQVSLSTDTGANKRTIHPKTRGLPQGGVLPPLLWLLYFNNVPSQLKHRRRNRGHTGLKFLDLIYADDITHLIARPDRKISGTLAWTNADDVEAIKREKGQKLAREKTKNLVRPPTLLPDKISRRTPKRNWPNIKNRLQAQYREAARNTAIRVAFDPYAEMGQKEGDSEDLPFPLTEEVKVLGIQFDHRMTMDTQMENLRAKAQLRQEILAKVSRQGWGLEAGLLQITHSAVITSLLRYRLVVQGSCMPPDLFGRIETNIVNTAARRITVLDRSTRVEVLHFLTATYSFANLYVLHCAEMIDAGLRATGSTTQVRLKRGIAEILGNKQVNVTERSLEIPTDLLGYSIPKESTWRKTAWFIRQYEQEPKWNNVHDVPSMYVCHAEEINNSILQRMSTYHYIESATRIDVGIQICRHLRWAPECSSPQATDIPRASPPKWERNYIIFGPRKKVRNQSEQPENEAKTRHKRLVTVDTLVARIDQVGATVCILLLENRIQQRSIVAHGLIITKELPAYLQRVSILHPLRVLHDRMRQDPKNQEALLQPEIYAGDGLTVGAIERWLQKGTLELRSPAASPLVEDMKGLPAWLNTGIRLLPFPTPEDKSPKDLPYQIRESFVAIEEFRRIAIHEMGNDWIETLPRVPLTK